MNAFDYNLHLIYCYVLHKICIVYNLKLHTVLDKCIFLKFGKNFKIRLKVGLILESSYFHFDPLSKKCAKSQSFNQLFTLC